MEKCYINVIFICLYFFIRKSESILILAFNKGKRIMNKEIISIALALGCVSSIAATNNYDLLGRKGSKMNSPMVYKNVDYSKVKKNEKQKVGSSLESRSLQKTGVGLKNNVVAIEGTYNSTKSGKRFHLKTVKPTSASENDYYQDQYFDELNKSFISTKRVFKSNHLEYNQNSQDYPLWANPYYSSYHESLTNPDFPGMTNYRRSSFNQVPFDYVLNQYYYAPSTLEPGTGNKVYADRVAVMWNLSYYGNVQNWFDGKSTDVGVFLGAEALPVRLGNDAYPVNYFKRIPGKHCDEPFNPAPGYEKRESQSYAMITAASGHVGTNNTPVFHSLFFVDVHDPVNVTSTTPQIYIGVRNNDIGSTKWHAYNEKARALDDFIYENRTIEFVPSGNYGHATVTPSMFARAFAANAITVGAVDVSANLAPYTSMTSTDDVDYVGVQKPEIYNYSRMYANNEMTRSYGSNITYKPLYDGTEVSAAYTAGMVVNLLATSPFYRWHPEVVKALLLTSTDGFPFNYGLWDYPVTTTTPSYKYLVFDDVGTKSFDYISKFWHGDINSLKTGYNKKGSPIIQFCVPYNGKSVNAAIAWINKGTEISRNNGSIPQDFDLEVFESDDGENSNNPTLTSIARSNSAYNSYERVVNVTTRKKYLWFRITLFSDDSSDENKGQVVLGFNLSRTK